MITKAKAFLTTDNHTFATVEEAQTHELARILEGCFTPADGDRTILSRTTAKILVANAEEIADILTTKGSSKPAARSVNGGTKKRKPKTDAAPASAPALATA